MPYNSLCVFCGSASGNSPAFASAARALAQSMFDHGTRLVYGGGQRGLMGIVSRDLAQLVSASGADANERIIGVIPSVMVERGVKVTGRQIVVSDMHARKKQMADLSDAFVALPGGFGTWEEVLEMTTWVQLAIHDKPIIILNINGFFDPFKQLIENAVRENLIRGQNAEIVKFVDQTVHDDDFDWGNATYRALKEWRLPPDTYKFFDWARSDPASELI